MEHSLFNPLPGQPPRSKYFAAGWSLQLLLIVAVLALNALVPKFRPPARHYVLTSLVRYQPELPTAPPPVPRFQVRNTIKLPVMQPSLVAKAVLTAPVRKPNPSDVKVPEIKLESRLPQLPTAAPSKVVALDTFSSGSSAAPTTERSARGVQTGGFGDPELLVDGDDGGHHRAGGQFPGKDALAQGVPDLHPRGDVALTRRHGAELTLP